MLRKQKSEGISLWRNSESPLGIADAEAAATVRPARLIDLNRIYMEGRVLPQTTGQAMHPVEKVDVKSWKFCLLLSSYLSRFR